VAGDGINRRNIDKFVKSLQREFDKRGPIRIPVVTDSPELPPIGTGATVNYHGPVFHGDMSGAQIAWNNQTVTQAQNTSPVTPGYEQLAEFIVQVLQQLPSIGLPADDCADAESAARDALTEVTRPEPEASKIRRALNALKGVLAPIATGVTAGAAEGAQEWSRAAIEGLTLPL